MVEYYPTSVRLPVDVRNRIKSIAKTRNTTPSAIIIEACIEYLDKSTPGLCPSCHTQNNPDSQYCQKCGSSLVPGVSEQSIQYQVDEIKEQLRKLEEEKELMFKRYMEKMNEK